MPYTRRSAPAALPAKVKTRSSTSPSKASSAANGERSASPVKASAPGARVASPSKAAAAAATVAGAGGCSASPIKAAASAGGSRSASPTKAATAAAAAAGAAAGVAAAAAAAAATTAAAVGCATPSQQKTTATPASTARARALADQPPQTPQSEFKLLPDDFSPSFGGGPLSSVRQQHQQQQYQQQQQQQQQQHQLSQRHAAPTPYSPLVPFNSSSKSSQAVPSSREWYTSSSSDGSNNEWSNGIPEFSFSQAGSPVAGVAMGAAGGASSGLGGMGIGFALPIGSRAKRLPAESADIDPSFGALFYEGPPTAAASASGSSATSTLGGLRRRKKRRGSSDFEGGDFLGGSPLTLSALRAVTPESGRELSIRCNCKRSKCLKLYCDCLRVNKYCEGCNCTECNNGVMFAAVRNAAVASIMERNPDAFKARISEDPLSLSKEHLQGCHCKKSACLKKYCECFSAGAMCGERCRCTDCLNGGGGGGRSSKDVVEELGTKKSARTIRRSRAATEGASPV